MHSHLSNVQEAAAVVLETQCDADDMFALLESGIIARASYNLERSIQVCPFPKLKTMIEGLFVTPHMNAWCYNRLYCNNEANLYGLAFHYNTQTQVQAQAQAQGLQSTTMIPEIGAMCNERNVFFLALIDAVAVFTHRYDPKPYWFGREKLIDIYNAMYLMGGGADPTLTLVTSTEQEGQVEYPDRKIEMDLSKIQSVELVSRGKWWTGLPQLMEYLEFKIKLKEAIVYSVNRFMDDAFVGTSCITIIIPMLLVLAADKIYNMSFRVQEVIDELMTDSIIFPPQMPMPQYNSSLDKMMILSYDREASQEVIFAPETREEMKMFKIVNWMFDVDLVQEFGLRNLALLLNKMPFVAYEMIPVAAKLVYALITKVNFSDNFSDIIELTEKLHCGDCSLSLVLYGCFAYPEHPDSVHHAVLTRARLIPYLESVLSIDYKLQNTILGKETVLYYIGKAVAEKNVFVLTHLDTLLLRCTQLIRAELLGQKLISESMLVGMESVLHMLQPGNIDTAEVMEIPPPVPSVPKPGKRKIKKKSAKAVA